MSKAPIRNRDGSWTVPTADWRENLIRRLVIGLGHVVQKQGDSYECSRCGASGTAIVTDRSSAGAGMAEEVTVTGTIDRKHCGD